MGDRASDAVLIASLLAIDPAGLGGVWLRVRTREIQKDMERLLGALPFGLVRISNAVDDEALYGGIDFSASLTASRLMRSHGIFDRGAGIWLSQAQEADPGLSARLSAALDDRRIPALVLCDESAEDTGLPPERLRERVAFFFHDDHMPAKALSHATQNPADIALARARLAGVTLDDGILRQAIEFAVLAQTGSARVPLFMVSAARAHAALEGRDAVSEDDLAIAVRLVLAHRAMPMPDTPSQTQSEVENRPEQPDSETESAEAQGDVLTAAVATMVPEGLLQTLVERDKGARGRGLGNMRFSHLRGRPLPARRGALGGRARPDVLATLQAAAPWQRLRGAPAGTLAIQREDIRLRRFKETSERVVIFVVDASGSAAMARLGEAKGAAIELLQDAYQARDKVALISFRGTSSEVVLSPTRSLTRTKKALAGLAGGGGTPLALGLQTAGLLAEGVKKQGATPYLVVMTDGRANCDLNGAMDRTKAQSDAERVAAWLAGSGLPAVVLDSGLRTAPALERLAARLKAPCVPLLARSGASRAEAIRAALSD